MLSLANRGMSVAEGLSRSGTRRFGSFQHDGSSVARLYVRLAIPVSSCLFECGESAVFVLGTQKEHARSVRSMSDQVPEQRCSQSVLVGARLC